MKYYVIQLNRRYWLGPTQILYDKNMSPMSIIGPSMNAALLVSEENMTDEKYNQYLQMAEEHGGKVLVLETLSDADEILRDAFPSNNKNSDIIFEKLSDEETSENITYDTNDTLDDKEDDDEDDNYCI